MWTTIAVILVYGVAIIVSLLMVFQTIGMRSKMDQMEQQMLMTKPSAASKMNRMSYNLMRAYALSCYIQESVSLTNRFPPKFEIFEPRACGVGAFSGMEMRRITYRSPMWFVFHASRSSHAILDDVYNGRVQYLLFKGHVCRVRLPTDEEQARLKGGALPAAQTDKVRTLVICDDSEVEQDECRFHWAHPFPHPQTKWPDVFKDVANSESNNDNRRTVAHLWGYSTSMSSDKTR